MNEDKIFEVEKVEFKGKKIFEVIEKKRDKERSEESMEKIEYEEEKGIYYIDMMEGMKERIVKKKIKMERGNEREEIDDEKKRIRKSMYMGGKENLYMEGKV